MTRFYPIAAIGLFLILILASCSGGSPVAPSDNVLTGQQKADSPAQTHLWGLYEVYFDRDNSTLAAVPDRHQMFTCNVVNFLNSKPTSLSFKINGQYAAADYVDIDIDVTLTHPFPGMPQYNGYDVRGVFMGDGSASMQYNPKLLFAADRVDQTMLPSPMDGFGGPDGYTRWFNRPEFSTGGMPLFQYTKGRMANPDYTETATLNPYKYFADGLGPDDNLWTWLNDNASQRGVFSHGVSNTRRYYIRFPNTKMAKFGYAVIASWKGPQPQDHPGNTPEAVALSVESSSTVYYAGPTVNGGDLIFDISVWDWDSHPVSGVMQDYGLIIESTALQSPHAFYNLSPTGGDNNYSTYHVDVPADNLTSTNDQKYWVIVEDLTSSYKNDFGVSNLAGDDLLAAFFRYDLYVSSIPPQEGCPERDWTSAGYSDSYYSADGFTLSWNESYHFPPRATRATNPPRIFAPTDDSSKAIGVIDAQTYSNIPYSATFSGQIAHLEITSDDKVIYVYTDSNQVKSRDYIAGSDFSAETDFGPPLPQYQDSDGTMIDGSTWKMTITDNDNPAMLLRYPAYGPSSAIRIFQWDGSGWGDGMDLPQQVQDANIDCAGFLNASNISDFDYDPVTGNFLIAMHDNAAKEYLQAFDKSGNMKWSDSDVFHAGPLESKRVGIEIPKDPATADCRTVVFLTHEFPGNSPTYFTIVDSDGKPASIQQLSAPADAASNNAYEMGLIPPVGPNPWRLWGQGGFWPLGKYNYVNLPNDF